MDELAAAASKNPLDFRLELLAAKPRHAARAASWRRSAPDGVMRPRDAFRDSRLMEGYTTYLAQVAEISVDGGELKVHKITCVVDCGQMVNPRIVESQIESGIVFGLSAALWGEVTISGGQVQQTNFNCLPAAAQQRSAGTRRASAGRAMPRPAASANLRWRWWRRRSAMRYTLPRASGCEACRLLRTRSAELSP